MYKFSKFTYLCWILISTTGLGLSLYIIRWNNLKTIPDIVSEFASPVIFLGCLVLFTTVLNKHHPFKHNEKG